jgi:hypothetical protein
MGMCKTFSLLCGTAALFAFLGCSASTPRPSPGSWVQKYASQLVHKSDLGEVPGGLIDSQSDLVPMFGEGGETALARTLKESTMITNVAEKASCMLPAGTDVTVIAKNGAYLRVLTSSCGTNGGFVEGFVPEALLQEVVAEPNETSETTTSVNVPNGSSDSATVNIPNNGSGAGDFLGCKKVGLTFKKGDKICQTKVGQGDVQGRGIGQWYKGSAEKADYNDYTFCVIPGDILRNPANKYNSSFLAVEGDAPKWKIVITNNAEGSQKIDQTRTVESGQYKTSNNRYDIRMAEILDENKSVFQSVTFKVIGLDNADKPVGSECGFLAKQVSPLVLDIANVGHFDGTGPAESSVKFDFAGKGSAAQTGWIKPTMGFLAFDKNGNGKIDDGSEMFGEATRLKNGKTALNGYLALQQFDSNQDGMITASDSNFNKLVVWIDSNSNGITNKGELRSLASLQIHKIGLAYSPSHRHGMPEMLGNDVRYEARYWGPSVCGVTGCLSFDVYFSSVLQTASLGHSLR